MHSDCQPGKLTEERKFLNQNTNIQTMTALLCIYTLFRNRIILTVNIYLNVVSAVGLRYTLLTISSVLDDELNQEDEGR